MIKTRSVDKNKLVEFVKPYYVNKDIMHGMWHVELIEKAVSKILGRSDYNVENKQLLFATYFHGIIYDYEADIRKWLTEQGLFEKEIKQIITISHESHRYEIPQTLEGKILHDAHIIEGGKSYMITKCLITGSVRGQTLLETIEYIETNILDKSTCYLPETIPLLNEANLFAKEFLRELKSGIV